MTSTPLSPPEPGLLRTFFPSVTAALMALIVCVLAPSCLIVLHVRENPRLSPIDEAAQFDYVSRVADGNIPRLGQPLLPSTLKIISCTGSAYSTPQGPPCPGSKDPRLYAGGGYQYEAQQPPTYYAAEVPFRWVGVHLFGLASLTAARLVGALWVSLGLLLTWMAGRVMGVSTRRLAPAILLLASAPSVVYQGSIVSNDAPALFAGALLALLGALAWCKPGRWMAPTMFVSAALITSLKLDDALAAVVIAAVLAVGWWGIIRPGWRNRPGCREWLHEWARSGGMMLLGAAASAVAWILIDHRLNLIDPRSLPSFGILRTVPVGISLIAKEALNLLNPLANSFAPFRTNAAGSEIGPTISLNLQTMTAKLVEYLFVASGLGVAIVEKRQWSHWLGGASLVGLYLGGLVLGIGLWRTYNVDPSLSGRYGLAVAPLLGLALVANLRGRWMVGALWAFSVSLFGLTVVYIMAA
jgi:hypothetical protein